MRVVVAVPPATNRPIAVDGGPAEPDLRHDEEVASCVGRRAGLRVVRAVRIAHRHLLRETVVMLILGADARLAHAMNEVVAAGAGVVADVCKVQIKTKPSGASSIIHVLDVDGGRGVEDERGEGGAGAVDRERAGSRPSRCEPESRPDSAGSRRCRRTP